MPLFPVAMTYLGISLPEWTITQWRLHTMWLVSVFGDCGAQQSSLSLFGLSGLAVSEMPMWRLKHYSDALHDGSAWKLRKTD